MKLTSKQLLIYCGIIFSLASGSVYAGQVSVPHDFVSGTTAKASEVNNNFNALEIEVNDNDARITTNASDIVEVAKRYVVVDANDQIISGAISGTSQGALIMSPQGYVAHVGFANGVVDGAEYVFYADANCTGTAYASDGLGVVFNLYGSTRVRVGEK